MTWELDGTSMPTCWSSSSGGAGLFRVLPASWATGDESTTCFSLLTLTCWSGRAVPSNRFAVTGWTSTEAVPR